MEVPDYVRLEARKELARRFFYDYQQLKYPKHYTDDRVFLKDMCERLQWFVEQNDKRILIINVPPRHYKSFTGTGFVEWYFGKFGTDRKVMTGSYNETLSTTFARKVRNTIEEKPVRTSGDGERPLVYSDIFPQVKVQYGQASASLWALEGSSQDNYLATSPTGTATGFGANLILIDDIIKNAEEAYNELTLEKHWSWFTNTMMQRTEGDDWKLIVIMTRWADGDLAGRIIEAYDDIEVITYKAVQDDGTMLCDSILNRRDYELKTQEMNLDIVEANYNQKPIDVAGRLYTEFPTYDRLPEFDIKYNYTDTADKGPDFLCSVDYVVKDDEVYVTDLVFTDEAMETTEPLVARMLVEDGVNEALIESNNGGRGFARNVIRIMSDELGSNRCTVQDLNQGANKESRILASSAWVNAHVHFPANWKSRWKPFYNHLMKYQRKGKNAHDDGPDVLAGIYEQVTNGSGFLAWARQQKEQTTT